ncbi:hypothetical protein BDR04DRAFT_1118886 [Suillus decipiens]|nr:hypothetical protein BDR04DRAFT_1118886 [Suillus decipiens]
MATAEGIHTFGITNIIRQELASKAMVLCHQQPHEMSPEMVKRSSRSVTMSAVPNLHFVAMPQLPLLVLGEEGQRAKSHGAPPALPWQQSALYRSGVECGTAAERGRRSHMNYDGIEVSARLIAPDYFCVPVRWNAQRWRLRGVLGSVQKWLAQT